MDHGLSSRLMRTILSMTRALSLAALMLVAATAAATAAAPAPAAPGKTLTFAVIGDTGTGKPDQYAIAAQMEAAQAHTPFSLVLMLGDNLYGDFLGVTSFVNRFEKPYAALLKRGVTFRAVLGNHTEAETEIRYKPFGMDGRRYYTFTAGDGLAQFFALDSDRLDAKPPDADQLAWLEKELKASTAPWKIAFYHNPIYNAGRTHGPNRALRDVLEPLLKKYGVRLSLSGHEHVYQRLKPHGRVLYFIEGSSAKVKAASINRADPDLAAGNDSVCSFMLFTLTPAEATWRTLSAKGETLDSGTYPVEGTK